MISDQDFAHWVYRLYDDEGRLLYVGMTVNPKARLKSWRSVGRAAGHWWPQVSDIRWEPHNNKADAANAERAAIGAESPLHNVNLVLNHRSSRTRVREIDPHRIERATRMLHAYVDDDMTLEQINDSAICGRCAVLAARAASRLAATGTGRSAPARLPVPPSVDVPLLDASTCGDGGL